MEAGRLIQYLHNHFQHALFEGIEQLQLSMGKNPMLYMTITGKRFLIRAFEWPELDEADLDFEEYTDVQRE